MLSRKILPFMKAVWFGEISLSMILISLLFKALLKILKLQLIRAIGLNFFISVALCSLLG
jgi:hypothetical protein